MNKTVVGITTALVIILIIAGIWWGVNRGLGGTTSVALNAPIKIGFIAPLTEDAATYGQGEKNAVEMAVREINAAGGVNGRMLEIIYEDGKCNGKDAVTAIQKLINIDKVKVVLGGVCSAETLGAAPVAEQNRVILFSSFSSNPDIAEAGDYIFRNCISDLQGGKDGAEMVKEKKVGLLTENTDYSQGVREVFKEEFKRLGGEILADEIYALKEKDFRTYLAKIKEKNPEALFINPGTSSSAGGLIIKQARELGIEAAIYGNFILGAQDSLEVAGELANGVVFFDAPGLSKDNPKVVSFLHEYKSKYGAPPNEYEVGARYDSVFIIAGALRVCGEDTNCLKNYLYGMGWYDGTIGRYKFDSKGEVVGLGFAIKEIRGGEVIERR